MKMALVRFFAPLATVIGWGCGGGDLVLPAGEPVDLTMVSGNSQSAQPGQRLGDSLVVRLLDQEGTGVSGGVVTWDVSNGGGVVDPATSTTDSNGFAYARLTLGPTPGPNTVSASVSGVGTVTFAAMAQVDDGGGAGGDDGGGGGNGSGSGSGGGGSGGGGGSTVVPSASLSTISASPTAIVAGGTATITVVVRSEAGERVSGASVVVQASGGGAEITQPAGPTNVDGVATATLRATQAGTKQVTALVNGSTQLTQTVQVTVSGPVHHLAFVVPPHDVQEGDSFTVKVALMDVNGNIAPLDGIEIYVDLFRAGRDHPDNQRALGDRFRDTQNGVATFDLRVINGSGNEPTGITESGYRLRALTDELPELGPHGPEPWLFSQPFDVR